ncbi:MAG: RimK family alpha-L-glutamate ligase [Candidatus Moraniibacteriota bacterium]
MEKVARKLVFFTIDPKSKRLKRFEEEAEAINLDFCAFNSQDVTVTNEGVFINNKKITFNKGDIVWFIANPTINHYLIRYLNEKYKKELVIWPNNNAIDISNKYQASVFFDRIGVKTPKTVLINSFKEEQLGKIVEEHLGGFPCIIKSCRGSMGKNVELVNNVIEAISFMDNSVKTKIWIPFKASAFLFQEFIKESAGSDYRILCLNGKILGAIRRTSQNGGFKANISLGGKAEIIEIDERMEDMAKKIIKEGDIFYAGIDFIKKGNNFLAIEINTSSQFKGFEKATGINVAEKIIFNLLRKSDEIIGSS